MIKNMEEVRLSPKNLADILTSDTFLNKLRKAGNVTYNTFCETCFEVYLNQTTKKIQIYKIYRGNYTSNSQEFNSELDLGIKEGIMICFIHFHPDKIGAIVPSHDDLRLVRLDRINDYLEPNSQNSLTAQLRVMEGIGKIRGNRDIELLLYQEKKRLSEYEIEKANEKIGNYLLENGIIYGEDSIINSTILTVDIVSILRSSNFNACILNFSYASNDKIRRKNKAKFTEILDDFAQTIKINSST